MKPITLIVPFYRNQGMLLEQQKTWAAYPAKLRKLLHVIVVDDGSPKEHALPVVRDVGLASFQLWRCTVDVRWNWIACRNHGASLAPTEWMLLTDIDHVLPEKTLRKLCEDDHDPACVYRFSRVDAPAMTPYHPHPNSWFLTRKMFDRIGGYDERFSGFYGTDADFRDRVRANADSVEILPEELVRYPREVIPDASTTTYGRKEPQDRENVARIRRERALVPKWRPLRGTYKFVWQM